MNPEAASANEAATVAAAAILDDGTVDVDTLLASIIQQQRQAGRRVRGLVMTHPDGEAGCAGAMVLVDIETHEEYLVSQPLGSGSSSCRADTQGFARASQVLRDALHAEPELVVSNRFGSLEAEGGGFAAELLELMAHGVPLLTVVAARQVDAWERFTGAACVLPAQACAVTAWIDRTLVRRPEA